MRLNQWAIGLGLIAVFAANAAAQEPEPKKPGGLNKIARDVSKESKKAGRQLKENVKDVSSDAHIALNGELLPAPLLEVGPFPSEGPP